MSDHFSQCCAQCAAEEQNTSTAYGHVVMLMRHARTVTVLPSSRADVQSYFPELFSIYLPRARLVSPVLVANHELILTAGITR